MGAEQLDTLGMYEVTASLPEQVFDAAVRARGLSGLPDRERIEHVVVLGMGGSGVAGDVLAAAAGPFLPVPVIVSKGYELPAFVGESSLVFAVSFSGNTEETVEAASSPPDASAGQSVPAGSEITRVAVTPQPTDAKLPLRHAARAAHSAVTRAAAPKPAIVSPREALDLMDPY